MYTDNFPHLKSVMFIEGVQHLFCLVQDSFSTFYMAFKLPKLFNPNTSSANKNQLVEHVLSNLVLCTIMFFLLSGLCVMNFKILTFPSTFYCLSKLNRMTNIAHKHASFPAVSYTNV